MGIITRVLCVILMTLTTFSWAHQLKSHEAEFQLKERIFERYDKTCTPLVDHHHGIKVKVELFLLQIISFNTQSLESNVLLKLKWVDDRLKWDESARNLTGRQSTTPLSILVDPTTLWLPDVTISNALDNESTNLLDDYNKNLKAKISHTGEIVWNPKLKIKSSCNLKLRAFPFDVQTCDIKLSTDVSTMQQVELINSNQDWHINLDHFHENNMWRYVNDLVKAKNGIYLGGEIYSHLDYTVTFQRKATYYIVNIVVPCLIFASVSLVVFVLPGDSGERLGVSLSVLVSESLFQGLVMNVIPKTTDAIPILTWLLTSLMLIVCFSTIASATIIKMYSKNLLHFERQVPQYLWSFFFQSNFIEDDELLRKIEKATFEKRRIAHEIKMKKKQAMIDSGELPRETTSFFRSKAKTIFGRTETENDYGQLKDVTSTASPTGNGDEENPPQNINSSNQMLSLRQAVSDRYSNGRVYYRKTVKQNIENMMAEDKLQRSKTFNGTFFASSNRTQNSSGFQNQEEEEEEENCDFYLEAMEHIDSKKVILELQYLQWKYIAMCCDKFCLWLFGALIFISALSFFTVGYLHRYLYGNGLF